MSGKKQSFSFRLPWLPSLVSAPVRPGRSSSSQRNRKTATPPPPPTADAEGMIPIQRQVEQVEDDSSARVIRPLTQPEIQPPLPVKDLLTNQPHQFDQNQLTEEAMSSLRTDSQSPSERPEAVSQKEATALHIPLSGTDSTPLQLSSTSSDPLHVSPDQATQSKGAESHHSPLVSADKLLSPAGESKQQSPSQATKLILSKPHSAPSTQLSEKPSPTRAKPQSRSPSHTSALTRANSNTSSLSKAGKHVQSSAKQSSPSQKGKNLRTTTSLPTVRSRTIKFAKSSPKSSSSSLFSSPPSSPSFLSSPSSYSTGESSNASNRQLNLSPKNSPHAQMLKHKTHASQEYEHKSALPREGTNHPDDIKSEIHANELKTPATVYDKGVPEASHALELKEVITTRVMEHPRMEETSDTEEDKSHWSARNKRKKKALTRVSQSSKDSNENRFVAHNSHEGEDQVQSNIPLHKEMKNDVSNLIEKLSLGKLGQYSRGEYQHGNIITISGDNKGATLHLNGKASSTMAIAHSDSDEKKHGVPGTKHEAAHERGPSTACINSNIQSINNSMLLNSSVHARNPGVHFSTLGNNAKSAEPKNNDSSSSGSAHEMKDNVTSAVKLEYKPPIIRRRCLRGLLKEPSESEADNPDKPRRHGCRVACGNKDMYDF